jgi:hypothetical protein
MVAACAIGIALGDRAFQALRAAENAPQVVRLTAEQDHRTGEQSRTTLSYGF